MRALIDLAGLVVTDEDAVGLPASDGTPNALAAALTAALVEPAVSETKFERWTLRRPEGDEERAAAQHPRGGTATPRGNVGQEFHPPAFVTWGLWLSGCVFPADDSRATLLGGPVLVARWALACCSPRRG